MAPEQGGDSGLADIRSDIYSVGCAWYHMRAGRPPLGEGGLAERLYKHLNAEPPDIRQYNPQVSPPLVGVLRRMLAKKPAERYQTPALLLNDLGRADGPPAVALPETAPSLTREQPANTRGLPRASRASPGRETPHEVK